MSNIDYLGINSENSKVNKIKSFLIKNGLSSLLYIPRKIFRLYKKIRVAKLYRKNSENIKVVLTFCEDTVSKDVFNSQLNFIKKYDYSTEYDYLKKNNLFEKHTKLIDKNEYFPEGIIRLNETEVFVDGGGFDGDTVEEFYKRSNGKFGHIFTFEPDKKNYPKLLNRIVKLNIPKDKVTTYQKGLYSSNLKIGFIERGIGSSISTNSADSIDVVSLDSLLKEDEKNKVSFIKLDIEGAEIDALEGMKDIISRNKPKLAICVYHKPEHFWEVPLLLKRLNPDYKIYFRQHALSRLETVCYAV